MNKSSSWERNSSAARQTKPCIVKEPLGQEELEAAISAEDEIAERFEQPTYRRKQGTHSKTG